MRILLWYWGRRGGGAQFTLGLARALARRDDVALDLSLSAYGELTPELLQLRPDAQVIRTYRNRREFLTALPRLPAVSAALARRAEAADVVISGMSHLWSPLVVPGLQRTPARFVPVLHDGQPHPGDLAFGWRWQTRRLLEAADAALALSDAVAAQIATLLPRPIPILRMPLLSAYGSTPEPAAVSRAGQPCRFLFFGRMLPYKGLDILRDAFALVRARNPSALLRVVGEGDAEACAPGIGSLPGVRIEQRWVPEAEIPSLLAEADLVVLPYREASQSGVIPQALAAGRPVLATPVGGLVEQVPPTGGLIAREVSPAAFADIMIRALDPAQRHTLSEGARDAGRAFLAWDEWVARLVTDLRGLLAAAPPS